MQFYPSKTNDKLNRTPFYPELVNGRVMVNPNYSIRTLQRLAGGQWPNVLCDSGAFQDIDKCVRLSQRSALERQLRLEEQLRWYLDDHSFHFEAICTYDQMAGVDEAIVNGKKVKQRGTYETARAAVAETLESASYYASKRQSIQGKIMFACQGITTDQYVNECLMPMLDVMQPGDYFAFGGFCIIGRNPKPMLPLFQETFARVLPILRKAGITRAHILGVCYPPAVRYATKIASREGVIVSTDSSAPEQAACIGGSVYDADGVQRHGIYAPEHKVLRLEEYTRRKMAGEHVYHPPTLAIDNIRAYDTWTNTLGVLSC